MNESIQKLAYRISEGFQSSLLYSSGNRTNLFHRNVSVHESSDLAFISGLVSTGLRGSALLHGEKILSNQNQLVTAARQHLPLIINTSIRNVGVSTYSTFNNHETLNPLLQTGCFVFVASSSQEEIHLTLLAHRIAELSLIPGIVVADYLSTNDVEIPNDIQLRKYLGDPDDLIESPTPAQEMVFGKTRKRIPHWFSYDTPVMMGTKKNGQAIEFEAAASQTYFYDHLPSLIDQAVSEMKELLGIELDTIQTSGKSSRSAIISIGGQIDTLYNQLSKDDQKSEHIRIKQLSPFPKERVSRLLKDTNTVTILEYSSGTHSVSYLNHEITKAIYGRQTKLYSAKYGTELKADDLSLAIRHMVTNQPKTDYFLGIEFTKKCSSYPKHDILLHEIVKHYPDISENSIHTDNTEKATTATQNEVPLAIRKYQDRGPKYSHLSRFNDNTAFFYENNELEELVADPLNSTPVVPSATASFFSLSNKREHIPVLDPTKCTGCGDCFVQCPHSALSPIALDVEQLVKAGADIATSRGGSITKLMPLYKNLSKVAATTINESETKTLGDVLPEAFESLANQMKLTGEKLATAKSEFSLVMDEISDLPVAVTEKFYKTPNSSEKGSGEMFSLVVDPASCTGCTICAQSCSEVALTMHIESPEILSSTKKQFNLWEQLPDNSSMTIDRLTQDSDYSSIAAKMLSRKFNRAMVGASKSENDSPYKTLLRLVTSITESVIQPKIEKQVEDIDTLIHALTNNVHSKLSATLPKDNLDSLTHALKDATSARNSIQEVVNQIGKHEQSKRIDIADLKRKTDLVEALKNLKWMLLEGPTGVGRSRYGLFLSGSNSLDWAKRYPVNNFTSPCTIHWNGSAPDQTLGLFHGQLRYLLDNIKLLRRAELESNDKYDSSTHDLQIAELKYEDLSIEEKQLIPPILLIAERDDLNDDGWSSLNKLMSNKYPVKVFLFDHIASPSHSPVASLSLTNAGMFSTIALKNAFVFQGGMGNIDHLYSGVSEGLSRPYPALFNLYATKLEKHGMTQIDWTPFASLALNSRAFPALRYDPGEKSDFLSGAINLDGNKENTQDWVSEEIPITEEDTLNYQVTWADWAHTQTNWKDQFSLVEDGSNNTHVAEYISLEKSARADKVPVILRIGKNGLKHYSVSETVIEMTEAVLSNWNTLQEVGGLLTEFPLKLREQVTDEISRKFEQNAAELKKDFERQLAEQEAGQMHVVKQQLKDKLVALSSMAQKQEV